MFRAKGFKTTKEFLSFADDLITFFCNIPDITSKIQILNEWSDKYKLKINNSKSGILFKTAKGHNWGMMNQQKFSNFPIVLSYKYLGIMLDRNFNLTQHFDMIENKLRKVTFAIQRLNCIHPHL